MLVDYSKVQTLETELKIEQERATHYRNEWQKALQELNELKEMYNNVVDDDIRTGDLVNVKVPALGCDLCDEPFVGMVIFMQGDWLVVVDHEAYKINKGMRQFTIHKNDITKRN